MKSDTQLMKENIKQNAPDRVRERPNTKFRLSCGCGYSGKAPLEMKLEDNEWHAYCKCEI
jgi:hypothetical protein